MNRNPRNPILRQLNGSRIVFSLLIIICLGISLDLYGLYRLHQFKYDTRNIQKATGVLWVNVLRKHGEQLQLNTKTSSLIFSCDVPGLGVSHSCKHSNQIQSGAYAEVEWMSIPYGLFSDWINYPIAVRQNGRAVLSISVDEIEDAQSRKIISDINFLGISAILILATAGLLKLNRYSNA